MDEEDDAALPELVYACDYCGRFTLISAAVTGFKVQRWVDDEHVLVIAATYCGAFCARQQTGGSVTRG
jgi:hypothetical protein